MSVRTSVFFLAALLLISVIIVLTQEWQVRREAIHISRDELSAIQGVRNLSQLVHLLQQERGLTAGQFAGHNDVGRALLLKHRRMTDLYIADVQNTVETSMRQLGTLASGLRQQRLQIDRNEIDWNAARQFYTGRIVTLLDKAAQLIGMNLPADLSRSVMVINNLAVSREKLGLMRAGLNRIYLRGFADPAETLNMATNYGAFTERLYTCRRDASRRQVDLFAANVESETFHQVIDQIESALSDRNLVFEADAAALWWRQATLVIDAMKGVETTLLDHVESSLGDEIAQEEGRMRRFFLAAIVILLVAMALTVYIVKRMLGAMSILMHRLDQVMRSENFGVRLPSDDSDEFGRINLSINLLLKYTENILHQKEVLANTDLLTSLPNRRTLTNAAEQELRRDDRYGNGVAVVFCDIDHFKQINDQHGHEAGDEALRRFGALLRDNVREIDLPGRWGGEEFLVISPNSNAEEAHRLAEKLRQCIEKMSVPPLERMTCSFGVAARTPDETFDALCQRADEALYAAKMAGRNRVCLAKPPERPA